MIHLYGDGSRYKAEGAVAYIDDVEVMELRPQDKVTPVEIQVGPVEKAERKQR